MDSKQLFKSYKKHTITKFNEFKRVSCFTRKTLYMKYRRESQIPVEALRIIMSRGKFKKTRKRSYTI
jgi:hypothetical protein